MADKFSPYSHFYFALEEWKSASARFLELKEKIAELEEQGDYDREYFVVCNTCEQVNELTRRSHDFAERFAPPDTKANQIISHHRNLRLALDKAEPLHVEAAGTGREVREEAPRCGYQDDRCPYPCSAPATITDIETGCSFCATHFRQEIF